MNNLKEVTKKSARIYYFLFVMLVIIGGLGSAAMMISSYQFNTYQKITDSSLLIKGLYNDLLNLRVDVKNYIPYKDEKYFNEFQKKKNLIDKKLSHAKEINKDEDVKNKIDNIQNLFTEYSNHFNDLEKLTLEKKKINSALGELHFSDIEYINQIKNKSIRNKVSAMYWQLFAEVNAKRSQNIFASNSEFASLRGYLQGINSKKLKGLDANLEKISAYIGQLSILEGKISKTIQNGLDVVGPKTANYLNIEIAQEIEQKQTLIGKELVTNFNLYQIIIIVSSIFSLMFAGYLVFIISRQFKNIFENILNLAATLTKNMNHVQEISTRTAKSSEEMTSAALTQASSIEESSQAMEEMHGMTAMNLESIRVSNELAKDMKKVSEEANHSISDLVVSMQEITNSNKQIEELVNVISEIDQKTKLIDEIVFQTKLLSFNASVEAERAGEHGRGFSVVAEEVGKLARTSGEAANEIQTILAESVKKVRFIVSSNHERVEKGIEATKATQSTLLNINQVCDQVLQKNQDVLTASDEQAVGIKQINMAITSLDQTTHQTTVIAQTTSEVVDELEAEASQLSCIVNALNNLVGDSNRLENSEQPSQENVQGIRVLDEHYFSEAV